MNAIILCGMPAVGKTTVARMIASKLKLKVVGGGDILKEIALEEGYDAVGDDWWDTEEGMKFMQEREGSPEFDREVDRRLLARAKKGDVVITSYTLPWLSNHGVKVWLSGTKRSRAERMARRDSTTPEECAKVIDARDRENFALYKNLYGISFGRDLSPFNIVVGTDGIPAEDVAKQTLSQLAPTKRKKKAAQVRQKVLALTPASDEMVTIGEEPTDATHGWEPTKRPMERLLEYGLIPLDKTTGPTSHEEVSWVRRLTGVDKAGHSGTLDPGVSGMLPIGLGHATKALGLLLMFPKEYVGIMRIHSSVPRDQVDRVIAEFTDEIYQRPPQRSSVKRETRSRRIYELEVLEQRGNLFLLRCVCQAGTYVRKLYYDIGEVLGVGATMVELRRTKVGPLDENKGIVTLHELDIAVQRWKEGDESGLRRAVMPIESCLDGIKKVVVKDSAVDAVCHGAMLAIPGILSLSRGISKGETVVLLTAKGELIGIAEAEMTTEQVESQPKGIAFPVRRVIMEQGTYPKMWKKQDKAEAEAATKPDLASPL